jgi:zinc protease
MRHRTYYHRSLFSGWVKWLLLLAVFAAIVYGGKQYFARQTFDAKKIVADSILKTKTFETTPTEIVSASGIKIWLMEDNTNPIISISFMFKRAGRAYDPAGKSGTAVLASELLNFGGADYSRADFQETMELNGINLSFDAGLENLSGQLVTPAGNLQTAAELLRAVLHTPHFADADLQLTKTALLEALKIQEENPENVLSLAFSQELFGEHPYANNPLGKAEDINAITSADLKQFAADNFAKDNLIIGIAGDISAEKAKTTADYIFADLPENSQTTELNAPELNLKPHEKHIERNAAQIISNFAIHGVSRLDADFYPLYIANYIFGGSGLTSRLSISAREKEGLTYGIYTYLSPEEKAPLLLGQFSSTPENYALMQKIMHKEWKKFAKKGVTAVELEAARSYLLASYNLRFASTGGISDMLVAMQRYGLGRDFLQKRNDYIRAVTLDEVNAAAAKYFGTFPVEVTIGNLVELEGVK